MEKLARPLFGGADEQWKIWIDRVLRPFSDRFWEPGCAAPQIKNFVADVKLKSGAKPSARRPFRLSEPLR